MIPGDATGVGTSYTSQSAESLVTAIDTAGQLTYAWSETGTGSESGGGVAEVFLRSDKLAITGTVHVATDGGMSVQQILDSQVLTSGDVILVTGTATGDATITAADAGVAILAHRARS